MKIFFEVQTTLVISFLFLSIVPHQALVAHESILEGQCQEIEVFVPPCPNNPAAKSGFYLILNEYQFTPYNISKHWNISTNGDDSYFCDYGFRKNSDNVTSEPAYQSQDGLPADPPPSNNPYHVNLWNTNVPVPPDCAYSCGEIKTMTNSDFNFKSYYFYGWGYIEAKVKIYAEDGQGAAMWLWSVQDPDDFTFHSGLYEENEIDIFETRHTSNELDATYHCRNPVNWIKVREAHQVTLLNHDFTNWTVFAVEWNNTFIKWFVNNTLIHQIDFPGSPPNSCGYRPPIPNYISPLSPFCLRFGTGANMVGEHKDVDPRRLPQNMEIEYIRAYRREGEKASPIKIFDRISQICVTSNSSSNSNKIISANYYPDAEYEWSSPAFEIVPFNFEWVQPQSHHNKMKIWCKPGIEVDKLHPIYLTTTFPWGHQEQDRIDIFVAGDVPPKPSTQFSAYQPAAACIFWIEHLITNESTLTAEYYYFITNEWDQAFIITTNGFRHAYHDNGYEPFGTYQIRYRENNLCGISEYSESSITMPPPPPDCLW